jgi:hypothetical protein
MKHRYGAITTAATLAALVLGTAPALAQIPKGPDVGGSTYNSSASSGMSGDAGVSTTDAIAGAKKSNQDVTNPSSSESVSGSLSGSGSASGSVKSDESASGSLKSDESPSASPSMGDDKANSNQDDRERMKQQEQMDKKTGGLDRAEIK